MTRQEIFDKVTTHLLTQMQQAKSSGKWHLARTQDVRARTLCLYRTDGLKGPVLKCAVGCLIEDRFYSETMEDESVSTLIEIYPEAFEHLGIYHQDHNMTELLCDLQNVHDSYDPPLWENLLEMVAGDHELEFNPPAAHSAESGTSPEA